MKPNYSKMNEAELRDAPDPKPQTIKELTEVIEQLTERDHDYGTCVYALSLSAVAAFEYVSHVLGVTGFQASCADMDILTRTRNMRRPWAIVDSEELLYPQYDIREKLEKRIREWLPWAREQAIKLLAENDATMAHPDVIAHWEMLAAGRLPRRYP